VNNSNGSGVDLVDGLLIGQRVGAAMTTRIWSQWNMFIVN